MKVIFIDIDGPLAWGTWMDGPVTIENFSARGKDFDIPYGWIKEDCEALAEIVESTNADLVVSSDWKRSFTLPQLRMVFQHFGVRGSHIVDTTTHFNPARKMSSPPEWDRACEIRTWVKAFKPKHWVAIDDMPLGINFQRLGIPKWRHMFVDGGEGRRLRDLKEEIIKRLNK